MGEIIESRRRHYVGLDADKASIPAGSKDPGDSFHANDKGKQYYWNGAAWKTGLGYEYVSRDVVAADKTQADLVMNGAWQVDGLDLSAIIPAGAVAAHLRMIVTDNAANSVIQIRANATTKAANIIRTTTQVANITITVDGVISIDADRLMDYITTAGITAIEIYVMGWFI